MHSNFGKTVLALANVMVNVGELMFNMPQVLVKMLEDGLGT